MRTLTLKRIANMSFATFGVLLDGGAPFAVTVERPWKYNRKGESCIPTGTYLCKRVDSPKFGDTFEVTGVPGRTEILFHKGNLAEDSHGCIIVGEAFNVVKGSDGITQSGEGFKEFKTRLQGYSELMLSITEDE